jgi:hypothetical protein
MNSLIKIGIPILAVMLLFIGVFSVTTAVNADGTLWRSTNTCPYLDNNGDYGNIHWQGSGMMGAGYGAYQGRNMMRGAPVR